MPLVRLHRKEDIEPFLRRNVFLHVYALGDLDDFFWPHTTWYGLEESGQLQAMLLLYTAFEVPTLMALGDPPYGPLNRLLNLAQPVLPSRMYAHLSPGCREVFDNTHRSESRGPHWKMALLKASLNVPGVDRAERLTVDDVEGLKALYAIGYPANWFDPRQLEIGYYGLREQGKLICAAGAHVYSPTQRVAALGNIVTHPDHRGRGHAVAVTARLCAELLRTVDHIGLNVKADNASAIACYRRLGFEPVAEYEEVMLQAAEEISGKL